MVKPASLIRNEYRIFVFILKVSMSWIKIFYWGSKIDVRASWEPIHIFSLIFMIINMCSADTVVESSHLFIEFLKCTQISKLHHFTKRNMQYFRWHSRKDFYHLSFPTLVSRLVFHIQCRIAYVQGVPWDMYRVSHETCIGCPMRHVLTGCPMRHEMRIHINGNVGEEIILYLGSVLEWNFSQGFSTEICGSQNWNML